MLTLYLSFAQIVGFPAGLCYDFRNNFIWSWDCVSNTALRWRNSGLAPRFKGVIDTEKTDPLLSVCTHTRLEALQSIPPAAVNSETEAALLLSHLDRISDLYGPPLVPMAESDVVNMVEVIAFGADDPGGTTGCKLTVRGQFYGSNTRGFNFVVLNDRFEPSDQRSFDTEEKDDASERLADFIESLPDGRYVLVATSESANAKLSGRAHSALRSLGADKVDKLTRRGSFAMIGQKGAAPGSAPQRLCDKGKGPATARLSLPAPRVPLAVEVSTEYRLVYP